MANLTAWVPATKAALIEASTTVATLTLLPELEYEITHLGQKADGTVQTDIIMLSVSGGTPATPAQTTGTDKLILQSGVQLRIGPGVSSLKYDAVANNPAFNITANVYRGGSR